MIRAAANAADSQPDDQTHAPAHITGDLCVHVNGQPTFPVKCVCYMEALSIERNITSNRL